MTKRKSIPSETETRVLVDSARRCCLCFGLDHDLSKKRGQIAHLDRDPSNPSFENLAFLCFAHHDEYDSRTSQSKGLQIEEVKRYRSQLYRRIEQLRKSATEQSTRIAQDNWDAPIVALTETERNASSNAAPSSEQRISGDGLNPSDSLGPSKQDAGVDRCAVTDERVAESPDHSTVESNDEGPDYVHSTSLQFERELDVLNECLARLREEKESAEETGLTGAILAAESEIEDTVSRIQFLRKRIDCIEKGYEFWDRFGLEMACEACCMWVSWMDLGHADEDGQLTFNENVNVRIPIEVQRKLGLATDTGLFRKFLLCEIFEIPDHEWEIASESIYYLFGSSDSDEHELFLVAGWTVNKDDVTVW